MAEMQRPTAELDRGDVRRLAGRRDVEGVARSLRLAVGEPEPERAEALDPSIPRSEAETTTSAATEEPQAAEGDSDA
jgi:hypothetical protein